MLGPPVGFLINTRVDLLAGLDSLSIFQRVGDLDVEAHHVLKLKNDSRDDRLIKCGHPDEARCREVPQSSSKARIW
jgi:hypothetical protein